MARATVNLMALAETLIYLDGRPISFENRPYLPNIYNSNAQRVVLRCGRQVEKSTFLAITAALEAVTVPCSDILIALPRQQQLKVLRDTRLMPILRDSPAIATHRLGRGSKVTGSLITLTNGSNIHLRAAFHSADSARGLSCRLVMIDEYQDAAQDTAAVLDATMAHKEVTKIILSGTSKAIDNPIEEAYAKSNRCEWVTRCGHCGHENIPDDSVLGRHGTICSECGEPISFTDGTWVARNPESTWGEGYWVSQVMAADISYSRVLASREAHDPIYFQNECLGIPTNIGDHLVSKEEVQECCSSRPMSLSRGAIASLGIVPESITTGIDWSGGSGSTTAIVVGGHDRRGVFHVLHMEKGPRGEDHNKALARVHKVLQEVPYHDVAADGKGNGNILNRDLLTKSGQLISKLVGVCYGTTTQKPYTYAGSIIIYNVDKARVVSDAFTHIRTKDITFPEAKACGPMLDDIWRETAEYDAEARTIHYLCPPGATDDILHALVYALEVSSYYMRREMAFGV